MLTPDQEKEVKQFMAEMLASGEMSLSEVQKEVNARFRQKMTYMEIRILAAELEDIDWTKGDPNQPRQAESAEAPAEEGAAPVDAAAETAPAAAAEENAPADDKLRGETVVELSKLARPGMLLSGTVKFGSGSTADWYIDQMGRLGLENLKGEKPDQQDIEAFQIKLEQVARQAMGR